MTTADRFHEKMVAIITSSYRSLPIEVGSQEGNNPKLERLNTALRMWRRGVAPWPEKLYEDGAPTPEYKDLLTERIKETLTAIRNFVADSAIFSEAEKHQEDGRYQSIMAVLKTPENPEAIHEESVQAGLYYRDLVHNWRYWETPGAHIQLMHDLSNVMASVVKIANRTGLETQREHAQQALTTLFPTELSAYGVCPGGHTDKIKEAKNQLGISPKDAFLSYWNTHVKSLLLEIPPHPYDIPILNAVPPIAQVHMPAAIDYIAGAADVVIQQKDSFMAYGFNCLTRGHLQFLTDKVFDFPKYLANTLEADIEEQMKGFDEATEPEKNEMVNELNDRLLRPFTLGGMESEFMHTLISASGTYHDAATVKNSVKQQFGSLLGDMLGIEQLNWQTLRHLEVSVAKRIESIPQEATLVEALVSNYALKGDKNAMHMVVNACPAKQKEKLFTNTMQECALRGVNNAFALVAEACPENLKGTVFVDAMLHCAKRGKKAAITIIKDAFPEHLKTAFFTATILNCAVQGEESALQMVQDACPENIQIKVITEALMNGASKGAESALKIVGKACPEDLKIRAFTDALLNSANTNHTEACSKIVDACPDRLKASLFVKVLRTGIDRSTDQNALDVIGNAFLKNLEIEMFGQAIDLCEQKGFGEVLQTIRSLKNKELKGLETPLNRRRRGGSIVDVANRQQPQLRRGISL